jgi:hypothetical protein
MRRRGLDCEEILAALLVVNGRRCDPPLDAAAVERVAASVCRYAPAECPVSPAVPRPDRHGRVILSRTVEVG